MTARRIAAALAGVGLALGVASPADAHTVVCVAKPYPPTYVGESTDKIVYGVKFVCTPSPPEWLYVESQAQRWPPPNGPWQDYGAKQIWQCGYAGRPACPATYTVFDWTYCVTGTHILRTEGYLEGWHHRWDADGPKQSYPPKTIKCEEQPRTPEDREVIREYHRWVRDGNSDR